MGDAVSGPGSRSRSTPSFKRTAPRRTSTRPALSGASRTSTKESRSGTQKLEPGFTAPTSTSFVPAPGFAVRRADAGAGCGTARRARANPSSSRPIVRAGGRPFGAGLRLPEHVACLAKEPLGLGHRRFALRTGGGEHPVAHGAQLGEPQPMLGE